MWNFARYGIGSDHILLIARFGLHLKAFRKHAGSKRVSASRVLEPPERLHFTSAMEEKLTILPSPTDDANSNWNYPKKLVNETLDTIKVTRRIASTARKNKFWLSNDKWYKNVNMKGRKICNNSIPDINTRHSGTQSRNNVASTKVTILEIKCRWHWKVKSYCTSLTTT